MKEHDTLTLNAENPLRAEKFYNDVFETRTNIGIDIHKIDVNTIKPNDQIAVDIIDVPDIDYLLHKVKSNGGCITVPKIHIPSVGFLAYFVDTEGNIIGVVQKDPR